MTAGLEQPLEGALALDQRHRAQVVAVQMEEVEGEEDQLVRAPLGERVLQGGEARDAPLVLHHDLAVDQRLLAGQSSKASASTPVAVGPVEPGAGEQPHLAVVDARDGPIAVELDLVQPVVAVGHPRRRRRQLRPDLAPAAAPSSRPSATRV